MNIPQAIEALNLAVAALNAAYQKTLEKVLPMTNEEISREISVKLGIPDWRWLYALINAESRWNPTIHNRTPGATARGLIQFIDSVARELGYQSSLDLVTRHPDVVSQMRGPVFQYLKKYGPYQSEHTLYLAVFRPADRFKPDTFTFPDSTRRANPGINTPRDYVAFVRKQNATFFANVVPDVPGTPGVPGKPGGASGIVLAAIAVGIYIFA